jgi:hypothetical protein
MRTNRLVQYVSAGEGDRSDPTSGAEPPPDVPDCLFPLRTEAARSEYVSLGRLLAKHGRLDADKRGALAEYVAQVDALYDCLARNMIVRPSRFAQLRRAREALRLHELEHTTTSQNGQESVNKFALHGFAARRRMAKQESVDPQASASCCDQANDDRSAAASERHSL